MTPKMPGDNRGGGHFVFRDGDLVEGKGATRRGPRGSTFVAVGPIIFVSTATPVLDGAYGRWQIGVVKVFTVCWLVPLNRC